MQENSMNMSVQICLQVEGQEKNIVVNHFPFRMGRDSSSVDLALPDAQTSRVHAQLILQNGGVWLENLSTTNGTFVNGERIHESVQLSNGDEAKIGKFVLHFTISQEEVASDESRKQPFTQQDDNSQEESPFMQETSSGSEEQNLCRKCGALLKPGVLFCGKCGTPVEQTESMPTFSTSSPQDDSSQEESPFVQQPSFGSGPQELCGKCGASLKPGALFCGKCGTPVERTDSVPTFSTFSRQEEERQDKSPFVQQPSFGSEPQELCGKCGAPLKLGALFCGKCGTPVERTDSMPTFSTFSRQEEERQNESPFVQQTSSGSGEQVRCGKCGAPLKPGALFCGKCGTPAARLDEGTATVSPYTVAKKTSSFTFSQKRKRKKFILLGGVAIVIIVFVIVLTSLFSGRSWETVIDQLFDSVYTADAEKYISVYSTEIQEAAFEEAKNSNFQTAETIETWDDMKDSFEELVDLVNDEFGKGWSYSYEITDETDIDEDMLQEVNEVLKEQADDLQLNVDELKEVDVDFTITSADGEREEEYTINIYLAKIKNSWYLLSFFLL